MRSCTLATLFLAFFLSLLPFGALESCLCAFASSFSSSVKNRGASIFSPLLRVRRVLSPASAPTASRLSGRGKASTSQEKQTYHFPVQERRIVQVFTLPSIGR